MDDDILWADIFIVKFYRNITFMNMIEEESYLQKVKEPENLVYFF
jgi:hypothetical protein